MLYCIILSILSGVVGTGLGGFLGSMLNLNRHINRLMYFVGGFMLSIVAFDLIPQSAQYGVSEQLFIFYIIGAVLVLLISQASQCVLKNTSCTKVQTHCDLKKIKSKFSKRNVGVEKIRGGLTVFFAIALHNLPEGLAIGGGHMVGFGVHMAILIAIHNVPEGVAMVTAMIEGGMKRGSAVWFSLLAGVPTAVGACVAYEFAGMATWCVGACLLIASGSMVYVTFSEILANRTKTDWLDYFIAVTAFLMFALL